MCFLLELPRKTKAGMLGWRLPLFFLSNLAQAPGSVKSGFHDG
jgi:hypothetical protein